MVYGSHEVPSALQGITGGLNAERPARLGVLLEEVAAIFLLFGFLIAVYSNANDFRWFFVRLYENCDHKNFALGVSERGPPAPPPQFRHFELVRRNSRDFLFESSANEKRIIEAPWGINWTRSAKSPSPDLGLLRQNRVAP